MVDTNPQIAKPVIHLQTKNKLSITRGRQCIYADDKAITARPVSPNFTVPKRPKPCFSPNEDIYNAIREQ